MALRSPGALLKDSFAFYKQHIAVLTMIAAIPAVLTALASLLTPPANAAMVTPPSLLVVVLMVLSIIASILSTAALVLYMANPSMYGGAKDAYMASKRFFWPLLLTGIISGLVIMRGFIALIVPGIIFSVWFVFSYFVVVLEDKRYIAALKASKEYTKGRWFAIFGRLLVLIVVCMGIGFVFGMITAIAIPDERILNMLTSLVSVAITPFALAYMYLLYNDAKASTSAAPIGSVL